MSVTRQPPSGVGPPDRREPLPPSGRPLWQQFLIGAVVVLLVVGVILAVVRLWAIPSLQSRGSDAGVTGQATLSALQTQQALTPRPTATTVVAPAAQPTVIPTSRPTVAPTSTPVAPPTLVPNVHTTSIPVVAQTAETSPVAPTATPLLGNVVVVGGTPVLAVNGTPLSVPTPAPDIAASVSEAYLRYWSVTADALLNLDSTNLDQVAAGDELASLQKSIDDLRAQGRALDTQVQHQMSVATVFDDKAIVVDVIHDSSVYVTPDSHSAIPGQAVPSSPEEAPQVTSVYQLEMIDGAWKVISSTWKVVGG